jgi:ABC-2 type transport system ATP-binding protein
MKIIEVEKLSKYYGKARGIDDISFDVRQGSIFGFIGPNGAGKSTTIRLLLSLIYPTSGRAMIFGLDCRREGHKIRQRVGYIPSEVNFYDDMRVKDFLRYAAAFYRVENKQRISYLCELFDVETGKKIRALSSGNKKKLAILQALIHEPELLILDEPTSGLDPLMQNRLYEILKEENKKGVTIFFSSHVLSEVQKMCNMVAILKEGRIIKTEAINLLRNSLYKKVRIEFSSPKLPEDLMLSDTITVSINGNMMEFIYHGDMDTIVKELSKFPVADLWVDDPDLEDIFMHYYNKGSH